jgi:hypothetical protein
MQKGKSAIVLAAADAGERPAPVKRSARAAQPPWPPDVLPPFLEIAGVAALLRTTPKAVERMIERHQLPGVCRPRGWDRCLVRTADVIAWISSSASSSKEK